MKGLLKYLSPFAPDQSGAVSVLFDLGGITVICDAGGCAGNICGFDEPRWFTKQSAVFSAGLRDMDAILGRDDRLVHKLELAAHQLNCSFASMIGTPVPAVIATDFKALQRMAEKRTNLPVITVDCTGTRLYDEGASEAYVALFEKFVEKSDEKKIGRIGVLGATPLDTSHICAGEVIEQLYMKKGYSEVWVYGMGAGLDEIRRAATVEKNVVIAPAGLQVAKQLKKRFGTPFEICFPMLKKTWIDQLSKLEGKKVLIVHQQVAADEIRKEIVKNTEATEVTVAGFFLMKPGLKQSQDVKLKREEDFVELVKQGDFDVIIGDQLLKRAIPEFKGEYIHIPHFAISGEYEEEICGYEK